MTAANVMDALAEARSSAIHLELRDLYMVDEHDYTRWREGTWEPDLTSQFHLISRAAVDRGVSIRRARVVSMPPSEYIRFEYATTAQNIAAGEDVRWLARADASALAVPVNDFWLFDGQYVIFNHFDGYGSWAPPEQEVREEPDLVQFCTDAFEAVWGLATPHAQFDLS